jgi:hypothetical protein
MVLITAKCICYVLLPDLLWEADKSRNIWHKTYFCYPENVLTGLLGSGSHVPPQPQRKLHFADKILITRPTDRPGVSVKWTAVKKGQNPKAKQYQQKSPSIEPELW